MWGLSAPLPAEHDHDGVVLILAFYATGESRSSLMAMYVRDDGQLSADYLTHLKLEWRFNWNTHTWEDTDIGDLYDESSDGGPEVPGDLPEPDDANRSDSGDQGDGASGNVDSE